MKKEDTSTTHKDKTSAGDMRRAAFDQRKRDFLRSKQDRPAVFIGLSNKHNHSTKIIKKR